MKSLLIPHVGGWLALLVLLHFTVDWIFQSHDEAMRKPREWKVRAKHCLVYTLPFSVVLGLTSWSAAWCAVMSALVFLSHFIEDTYYPILLWAKYVRRPPQMRRRVIGESGFWNILDGGRVRKGVVHGGEVRGFRTPAEVDAYASLMTKNPDVRGAQAALDLDGFVSFVSDPLGKILLVAVDQIVHILFLLPVAYMLATQP